MSDMLYRTDYHAWAKQQATLLREGRFDEIDREHLAEEVETLGLSEERGLESSYRLIMLHLLKWIHQPALRSKSWQNTIIRERGNIERDIRRFPGLKPKRDALFAEAYSDARSGAAKETFLPIATFPIDPPFTREQVEDDAFLPS